MSLINFTPHDVHIFAADANGRLQRVLTLARSEPTLRVSEGKEVSAGTMEVDGVPIPVLEPVEFLACDPIPEFAQGKDILVSWVYGEEFLKQHPTFEPNVYVPHTGPDSVVRSADGQIIGVRKLIRMKKPVTVARDKWAAEEPVEKTLPNKFKRRYTDS